MIMRTPSKWIGKRIPKNLDIESEWDYSICGNCGCFYHQDSLWGFIYPVDDADFELQDALHIEEAQGFCQPCCDELADESDAIDPEWRVRHGLV